MGRPRIELELQHTVEELRDHYRQAGTAVERRRTQVIWFLAEGKSPEEVAQLTAYSHVSLLDTIHKYNQHGLMGLRDQRANNPGAPTLLSDQEILLLAQAIRQDFQQGIAWRGQDVLDWVKVHCHKELHKPRAYELLAAIGFTLQVPRPVHTLADPGQIEDFKKRFSRMPSKQHSRWLRKLKSGPVTSTV